MRTTFLAVVLMMIGGAAHATGPMTNAQAVRIVVPYTTHCASVTISNSTPTELTGNTSVSTTTAGISWVSVQNMSTTNTVYCSDNSSVSASGNNIGVIVQKYQLSETENQQDWNISTMQKWYCIASAANTSINVCTIK